MTKILKANTAFYDVETAPNVALVWRAGYKLNVTTDNIVRERALLSAAWKYAGKKKVHGVKSKIYKDGSINDEAVVRKLTDGLADAELLCGHNSRKFDTRWVNGRALILGLPRLAPVREVDTLLIAKKYFDLNGYRLNYIASILGIGQKLDTNYGMWKSIVTGQDKDGSQLKYMLEYNKMDVVLLEKVYEVLERYNDSPVVANEVDDANPVCVACGSKEMQKRGKFLNLKTFRQRFQCRQCGKFTKGQLQKKDDYFPGHNKKD